jgi:hypothetical protein
MSDGQTLPAVRYRLSAYRWPTAPSRLPLVILSDSLCHPAKAGALWVLGSVPMMLRVSVVRFYSAS